jgi:transposase
MSSSSLIENPGNNEVVVLPNDKKAKFAHSFRVHVGVDAGKTFHKMVARIPDKPRSRPIRVEVSRSGFDEADRYLRSAFPKVPRKRFLVGIELAGNYGLTFANYLTKKGYCVVAVSGLATRRVRDLEDNSPRKDDDKDAAQICSLLTSGVFSRSPVRPEWSTELRLLIAERSRLIVDQMRAVSQLQSMLELAWPEFRTEAPDLRRVTSRLILDTWPLPWDLMKTGRQSIRDVRAELRSRKVSSTILDRLRAKAKETIALETAPLVRRAALRRLLLKLNLTIEQIAAVKGAVAEAVGQRPEGRALLTVPGVKPVFAAMFLGSLGCAESFESPRQLLKLAGMNLTRRQSGIGAPTRVRMSKRGRPMLRRDLFLLALRWCRPGGMYHADYRAMVERNGGFKKKAVCAFARRLVPMLLHIAKTGDSFDEAKWRRGRRVVQAKAVQLISQTAS